MTKKDGASPDIVAANIDALRELFPEVFADGAIDFDALRETLGGHIDDREERYSFSWHGKSRARRIAQTPSTGTLLPRPEDSVDWDTTQNIFIEGDNLEVLKLLQKAYHRRVKMIYIDPPYNTGKEFIYPDKYQENLDTYLRYTGQVDDEGFKLSANAETSGRFHTAWLNMMYPRLKLARNLLRDDGIILISIDDAEVANLRRLGDEVFGPENYVATLVWDRNRKNDAKYFSVGHEYMLVWFKDESYMSEQGVVLRGAKEGVDEVREEYSRLREKHGDDWEAVREGLLDLYRSIPAEDPRQPLTRFRKVDERGPYRDDGNINWPGGGGPRYEVLHPQSGKPCKLPTSGWRYPNPDRFWEEVERGRVVFGPDETTVPRVRTNLFENTDQVMVSVHYSYAQTATNQFVELFGGRRVFDNPKPVKDLKTLVSYLCEEEDLVLDFFAGSGSTGHAVMESNVETQSRRRFILVQLPESLNAEKGTQSVAAVYCSELGVPPTIAEISKQRLRLARDQLIARSPIESAATDLGFRAFALAESNIKSWTADFDSETSASERSA